MRRLFFLFALVPHVFFGQHSIKGVFSPAEDFSALILYKLTPTKNVYLENTRLNKDGSFEFPLNTEYTPGIYRIVYALPENEHNFDIIYNGKEDITLTFSFKNNVEFQTSSENKLMASYIHSMSMIQQSLNNYFGQKSKDKEALKAILKTQQEAQVNFEEAAKGTISLNFIKANRPYSPETEASEDTYFKNLYEHFFDNVDFDNKVLQGSNFLNERMMNYVFGIPHEDVSESTGFEKNIDSFYRAMGKASLEIKIKLLHDLWERMVGDGYEGVANYISNAYLIDLAMTQDDLELAKKLTLFRNTSIGYKAPDFSFEVEENGKKTIKKLSELQGSENYIIVFWSSTCSHCLEEIPQLEDFVKGQEAGKIKVIAIGLEDEPSIWKSTIKKLPDFIHIYGEGKWDNAIGDSYGVTETPTYFILNSDKEIISKPDFIEDVKIFFEE